MQEIKEPPVSHCTAQCQLWKTRSDADTTHLYSARARIQAGAVANFSPVIAGALFDAVCRELNLACPNSNRREGSVSSGRILNAMTKGPTFNCCGSDRSRSCEHFHPVRLRGLARFPRGCPSNCAKPAALDFELSSC